MGWCVWNSGLFVGLVVDFIFWCLAWWVCFVAWWLWIFVVVGGFGDSVCEFVSFAYCLIDCVWCCCEVGCFFVDGLSLICPLCSCCSAL